MHGLHLLQYLDITTIHRLPQSLFLFVPKLQPLQESKQVPQPLLPPYDILARRREVDRVLSILVEKRYQIKPGVSTREKSVLLPDQLHTFNGYAIADLV